jgi:lipopolysaccharide export LptBFGC system permease protein LptF
LPSDNGIWKYVTKHDSGTISANKVSRESRIGERNTFEDNKKRSAIIKSKLLLLGYGVTAIGGNYIVNFGSESQSEVKLDFFLVIDLKDSDHLKSDLVLLGQKFDQDSITYAKPNGEYFLIDLEGSPKTYTGNNYLREELILEKSFFGDKCELNSRIGNSPIILNNIGKSMETLSAYPPTEIRSIKALAESY